MNMVFRTEADGSSTFCVRLIIQEQEQIAGKLLYTCL